MLKESDSAIDFNTLNIVCNLRELGADLEMVESGV